MGSVPRYQLNTIDRGPSALLWLAKATWDKLVSTLGGSVAKDDFTPIAVVAATTTLYPGFTRNSTTTDFGHVAAENHGVIRIDYNTTAAQNAIFGAQLNYTVDPDIIDEVTFEVLITFDEDGATGGTIDFVGFSSETDASNSTDGVDQATTASADNHLGLTINASGVVSLVSKPNGSTAAATVIVASFATVTSKGNYHKYGVKLKRNGDGTFVVTGCVDNVLSKVAGTKVAASVIGTTAMKPLLGSRTPGATPAQVPASNLDWYACLNDTSNYSV